MPREHKLMKEGHAWRCSCGQWQWFFTQGDGRVDYSTDRDASISFWRHKKDGSPRHEDDEISQRIGEFQFELKGCAYCGHEDHLIAECPNRLAERR